MIIVTTFCSNIKLYNNSIGSSFSPTSCQIPKLPASDYQTDNPHKILKMRIVKDCFDTLPHLNEIQESYIYKITSYHILN